MASQSLYRKWRSQTFSDLVGQETITRTLKNALKDGHLAHAYLFTGPRGTGKTSTARLLAKTINCLSPKDSEPCNICEQCREITAGNSFNVIEIDAASNRGIDSIRDLREKIMMPPSTGKYKVYILDEAHMLTNEAFNALLKTLEEPPAHAIFVMATTDVHKMLPTVLSRCQRFDFKRITTQQIVAHLNFVAGEEQVELESGAADLIARAAAGGMRDALSLLDQAIAYAGQQVALSQVQAMLGVADPRAIQNFILHVAHLDSAAGLHLINELVEAGADLFQVNGQVAEFWRAMMLTKAGADIATIMDGTADEVREIKQAAQLFALEELTECARIFAQNDLVLKNQGTPQLGLELALLACIELHRRHQPGHAVLATASPAPSRPTATVTPPRPATSRTELSSPPVAPRIEPASSPVTAPRIEPASPPVMPPSVQAPQPSVEREMPTTRPAPTAVTSPSAPLDDIPDEPIDELPDWDSVPPYDDEEGMVEEIVALPDAPASEAYNAVAIDVVEEQVVASTLTVIDVKEKWEYVKRRIRSRKDGAKIAALLNGYTVVRIEETGEQPVIVIMANATFHYSALQRADDHASLEWALKMELDRECRVRLLPPGNVGASAIIPPAANNRAANASVALPPQQSARVERPSTPPGRPTPSEAIPPRRTAPSETTSPRRPASSETPLPRESPKKVEPPASRSSSAPTSPENQALARNDVVSENRNSITPAQKPLAAKGHGTTRQEVATQKAQSDPVVKEVVRMFKAEIKDIQIK